MFVFNFLKYIFRRKNCLNIFKSTNNSMTEMENVSILFVVFSVIIADTEISLWIREMKYVIRGIVHWVTVRR